MAVMVNFTRQLECFTECPDIWLKVISRCACEGVSRLAFKLAECVKQIVIPNMGGPHPVDSKTEKNRKSGGRENLPSSPWLIEQGHGSPLLDWNLLLSGSPESWMSDLQIQTELQHRLFWVSSLQTTDRGVSQPPKSKHWFPFSGEPWLIHFLCCCFLNMPKIYPLQEKAETCWQHVEESNLWKVTWFGSSHEGEPLVFSKKEEVLNFTFSSSLHHEMTQQEAKPGLLWWFSG